MSATNPVLTDHRDNPPEETAGPRNRWLLAGGVLVMVLVAAPIIWFSIRRATTAPPPDPAAAVTAAPQLGFSASHENTDWRLAWNRDAVAKLDPVGAMLSIRDGGVDRMQYLSPLDLASGSIIYVPRSGDLVFHLKVSSPVRGDIEEQIRVLGPDQARSTTPIYPTEATRVTPPARAPEASRTAPPVQTRPFQPPPSTPVKTADQADSQVAPPDVTLPAAALPELSRAAAPNVVAPAPAPPPRPTQVAAQPPAQQATPQTTAAPPRPTQTASAQQPPIVLPQRPAVTAPQSSNPSPQSTNQPAPGPSQSVGVTPGRAPSGSAARTGPTPLRMIAATWPQMVPRGAPVEVKVRVSIDKSGHVTNVVPLQRNVANYQFVNSAIAAAKVWSFAPATENGHPVAGESVLTFKFTP